MCRAWHAFVVQQEQTRVRRRVLSSGLSLHEQRGQQRRDRQRGQRAAGRCEDEGGVGGTGGRGGVVSSSVFRSPTKLLPVFSMRSLTAAIPVENATAAVSRAACCARRKHAFSDKSSSSNNSSQAHHSQLQVSQGLQLQPLWRIPAAAVKLTRVFVHQSRQSSFHSSQLPFEATAVGGASAHQSLMKPLQHGVPPGTQTQHATPSCCVWANVLTLSSGGAQGKSGRRS